MSLLWRPNKFSGPIVWCIKSETHLFITPFIYNSVRIYPVKLKISLFHYMNNASRNTAFSISANVPLLPLLLNISLLMFLDKYFFKTVGTGGARGALATPIFFSKVTVPFSNNNVNTFYLDWHKVKSCFRCIPSKIMIKFACLVMGKPFLAILEGLKLKFSPSVSAPTMMGPPTSLT